MICHGTADESVPFENAQRVMDTLQSLGVYGELHPFAGMGHGFFNKGRDDNTSPFIDTMRLSERFLEKIGWL